MRWRKDGSIQSTNVPTPYNMGRRDDNNLYRAIVTEVIYTDNLKNITRGSKSPRVLYNCIILGGFLSGTQISNCRLAPHIGGDFQFYERVLRPCSESVSKKGLMDQDGDIVYVQFIQGHSTFPLIVAVDDSFDTTSYGLMGATSEQGRGLRSLFNGVYEEITEAGNYKKIYGYDLDGKGEHFLTEMVDLENKNYTKLYGSGLSVTEDVGGDLYHVQTESGLELTVNGKNNQIIIKTPSAELIVDGNSGKISLKGQFVDLGESVTDMVTKYIELATAFATHTHPVPQSPSGVTQSLPPVAGLPMSVGSRTVRVQD